MPFLSETLYRALPKKNYTPLIHSNQYPESNEVYFLESYNYWNFTFKLSNFVHGY